MFVCYDNLVLRECMRRSFYISLSRFAQECLRVVGRFRIGLEVDARHVLVYLSLVKVEQSFLIVFQLVKSRLKRRHFVEKSRIGDQDFRLPFASGLDHLRH